MPGPEGMPCLGGGETPRKATAVVRIQRFSQTTFISYLPECLNVKLHSSFPLIHKGIFVLLLMKIYLKWLLVESTLMHIYIFHNALN